MNLVKYLILLLYPCLICCADVEKPADVESHVVLLPDDAIPFKLFRNHLYVECAVGGTKGLMVFDTGADHLHLDQVFYEAAQLNHHTFDSGFVSGVGGKANKAKILIDSVSFSIKGHEPLISGLVPILSLKRICGDIADGIIGIGPFLDKVIEINYANQYLRVLDDTNNIDLTGYVRIDCGRMGTKLLVPMEIKIADSIFVNGKYLLDLGSAQGVTFTSRLADQYKEFPSVNPKSEIMIADAGIGGNSNFTMLYAESVCIGGLNIDSLIVSYSGDRVGPLASRHYSGIVGNQVLKNFNLIVSYKHNCIFLREYPVKGTVDQKSMGFVYTDRSKTLGALIVKGVYAGSYAEKSGLAQYDTITHIAGVRVSDMDYDTIHELLTVTDTVRITVKKQTENHVLALPVEKIL
jgi:hypothetical protein